MTRRRTPSGFTLLEMLVALTITATIVSMVYGSYIAASGSAQSYRQSSTALQKAHLALHQLAAQIRCAYVPENTSPSSGKVSISSHARRDVMKVKAQAPLFTGSSRPQGDILQFVTMKSLSPEQARVQMRYATTVSLDRGSNQLILSQQAYNETARQELQQRRRLVLAERVTQITFAYYDGSQWENNWNSRERHGLPQAVRCELTIQADKNRLYTSRIIAPVLCAKPARDTTVTATSP